MVVEATCHNDALEAALSTFAEGYRPLHREYVVVSLDEALVITIRPKHNYEFEVRGF